MTSTLIDPQVPNAAGEFYRGWGEADLEIRAAAKGDGYVVEGIAVPWMRPTPIYGDLVEQFARGAFDRQLPAMHRVPFTHEHMLMGGHAIGRIHEARDDARGLRVVMRVSAIQAGEEALTLMRDGVYDELSIGFRQLKPSWSRVDKGITTRLRAELREVSLVIRGAYGQGAKVTGLRDEDAAPELAVPAPRPNAALAAQLVARLPRLPLG